METDINNYQNNINNCFKFNSTTETFEWFSFEEIGNFVSPTGATLDNSFCSTISFEKLQYLDSTTNHNLYCENKTYNNETIFISGQKKDILEKINKIDIGEINSSITYTGDEFDMRPILLAENTGTTLITSAFHEAKNAFSCKNEFIYVFQKSQEVEIQKIGKRNFGVKFLNKIKK